MKKNYFNDDIQQLSKDLDVHSYKGIYQLQRRSRVRSWLLGIIILIGIIAFLPWTQNIRASGTVTTLRQEQRPQQVNAVIAGSAIKWFVKEGDFVKAGDTIIKLGEVKVDYFDPNLLNRTSEQISSKIASIKGYKNKASTSITQAGALQKASVLKLESLDIKIAQQKLKLQTEEAELVAAVNELRTYTRQIEGAKVMLDSGAISLTEFEKRRVNHQNAIAKQNHSANQLLQARQELINLNIEKQSVTQDYLEKIAKADGERFASLSNAAGAEGELAKIQNQYANYDARNKLYYITASQSGQITKAKKAGIGEFIKEGDMIVEIVPDNIQYAVEMYVKPMDLPLVQTGQKVRFIFDGFPVIVFSGWPGASYGTFSGKIIAVETSLSANGLFRVLVVEDPNDRKWPRGLKMGGGATGIALLKNVRIYYEIWRNINGFPPDYYSALQPGEPKK